MRVGLFLACALLLVAGCFGPTSPSPQRAPDVPSLPIVRFAGSTLLSAPDKAGGSISTRLLGIEGSEPSLGFDASGTLYYVAENKTLRSRDFGASWDTVLSFEDFANPFHPAPYTEDPMLVVDRTTGRVFTDHLYFRPGMSCTALFWSDDAGATWAKNDLACSVPKTDHQKLAVGKPGPMRPPSLGADFPSVVYLCYNQVLSTYVGGVPAPGVYDFQTACTASQDGGATFFPETVVSDYRASRCGGMDGRPAVGPDGTAAVAISDYCPNVLVAFTHDSGLSWQVVRTPFVPVQDSIANDPDLAFADDGTLYVSFVGEDFRSYVGRSSDGGATWQGPWALSPPGVRSTAFPVLAAGADGRLGAALLGTTMWDKESSKAPNGTVWHLWVVTSEEMGASDPSFTAYRATADLDPVQIGCIWMYGGHEACRNLRDFMDLEAAPDGRLFVAFTDGCAKGCSGNPAAVDEDSRSQQAGLVWLDGWTVR